MENYFFTSILNFAAAGVCFITAIKLYFANAKNKKNIKLQYFFYSFIFITVYLFTSGLPFFVIKESFSIMVINSLFLPFLLIAGMFFCLTPINFTKFKKYEKLYIYTLLFVVLTSSILLFLGLDRALLLTAGKGFEYWARPEAPLIRYGMLISGISFILSLLFAVIFYFRYGFKNRKSKIVFGKSLMIGTGCLFFMFAVFSSYIIGITAERFLATSMMASVFFMIGAVSFISSITYKGEKKSKN
jgi:hypothetical protein